MLRTRFATAALVTALSLLPLRLAHAAESPFTNVELSRVVVGLSADATPLPQPPAVPRRGPSPVMWSFYSATAAVQGLDAASTFRALDAGARESNPLVSWATSSRPTFFALKAGIAAAAIFSAHNMSKHHKIAAVITLAIVNTAYGALVAHNYQLARRPYGQ